ncbi:ABC transporter permease [Haloglomus litoreum]|uniref:ABC transporter permease n=1 Tax=Haloglomus litoreum TaxID=3034026 RepID=UPI0023E7B4F6|nr:ABC transporter permease subunit [Haloglomus sp. DT116]
MSYRHVWKRDLLSSYRSRLVPVVALLLLLATAGIILGMYALDNHGPPPDQRTAVFAIGAVGHALIPLVGLLGSYSALAGERESGSVRFLMGLPNSRLDAFLGKFASRMTSVGAPLALGLLVCTAAVGALFQNGSYVEMLGLTAVTLLYALLFVGLGLALSAVASTSTRAVVGSVGLFALFRGGWPALQAVLLEVTDAERYPFAPDWYYWIGRINPLNAYVKLTTEYADFGTGSHPLLTRAVETDYNPATEEVVVESTVQSFAVTSEFAAIVLLAWTVIVPLGALAVWRRRDLL